MSPRDWGFALLIVFAWGFNFVVIHWGLDGLPPLLLGALRFTLVAFPAILFVPRPKIAWRWLLAYGLTISFGQFAFLFTAMKVGMPAGIASLVLQSQVLFTLLFAALLLHEHWLPHQPVTLGIAALGLCLLATQQGHSGMTLAGFLLTVTAAACWGVGNIINRYITRQGSLNLLSLVVWSGLIPPVLFVLASYWLEGPDLIVASLQNIQLHSILSVVYLALVATLYGYVAWGRLLRSYPVAQVAPLTLLVPLVGLLCARIFLDEQLNLWQWSGILLVLMGLLLNIFWPRWFTHRKRQSADQL
ncbi:MAG: O-acetylserine/cysteine exporter [Gammaproteobacteria bacterium]|nr:O-acetylserine/cysteine exporter [Gammaproteobacteria bacterium]